MKGSTKVHNYTQMSHLVPRLLQIIKRLFSTPSSSSSMKWAWTTKTSAASWASPLEAIRIPEKSQEKSRFKMPFQFGYRQQIVCV